jgi:tight adherence protein C
VIAIGLGLAWALAVALVLGQRPGASRRPPRRDAAGALPVPPPAARRVAGLWRLSLAALGGWLRRGVGRPPDPIADRRVGGAVALAAALLPWAPPLALLPLAWAMLAPVAAARRAERARAAAVTDQLPDVVDLLALTTAAGLPSAAAVCAIGRRPGGPLGDALALATRHISRGASTATALALVVEHTGPATRPLVDALAAHDRYGTALAPALERVAIESRLRRRRQAEELARRLPVTLLFPLVLTTLPAFVLLTVVPLLAGSLGSLSL